MEYWIRNYGAVGDGITNDTFAVQAAIDDCASHGGGRVICEAGEYLCATIALKSNIDFYLERGCTIVSSLDSSTYTDGHTALIEAKDAENISITGFGTIDGRSQRIFYDDNQDPLHEAPLDYPVGTFRPRTSMFENITNLTIRDITLKNSVFWTLHFAGCRYVTVSGIKILNDLRSNENDGIDPDCCKNVVISDCIIQAGDDPIVLKTTKEMAEKYGNCENVVINNCVLRTKSAGLKIGTETWGDIRNVMMSNCVIEECGRALAISARDGGTLEEIHVSNVRATCRAWSACKDNKHIGAGYPYWWGKGESIFITNVPRNTERLMPGIIRNITLKNMYIDSESSLFIEGSEYGVIENIEVHNSRFTLKRIGTQEPGWFDYRPSPKDIVSHEIPGIYAANMKALTLKDVSVRFSGHAEAWSNMVWLKNVKDAHLESITGAPARETVTPVRLENVTAKE